MSLRRRELVRRGAVGVAGALALSLAARAENGAGAPAGDREILDELLRIENGLERLHAELARRGGPGTSEAELFGRDCAEHARGLRIALTNRGGRPRRENGGASLPSPTLATRPTLAAAHDLETEAIAAYYRAHEGFGDLPFLPTLTSIMANHGQHLAVLRQSLGRRPTLAFETGGVE